MTALGGARDYPFVRAAPGSAFRLDRSWGVLRLTLREGRYEWVLQGVIAQADVVCEEGDEHPRRVEKMLEEISEPVGLPR